MLDCRDSMRPAGLVLLAAAAACHGVPRGSAGAVHDGLGVTIYSDRGARPGRAYVDDRRWLEVPAAGWLAIPDVAAELDLDSVVVASASDPDGFVASQCERVGAEDGLGTGAWLIGHPVALTTAGGAEVRGTVREVGGLVAVIHDDEVGAVEVVRVSAVPDGDDQLAGGTGDPRGTIAYGRTADGSSVYGPVIALHASTATVETATGERVVIALGALAQLRVEGVTGSPTLRCRVRARRPGRHLVRTAYASAGFDWSASYRTTLPPGDGPIDAIAVTTRYAISAPAPASARPATVELIAGLPGDSEAPVSVWTGPASIGGGEVVVIGAPVEREARLGWVYRGALSAPDDDDSSDYWHLSSHGLVWLELALAPRPSDVPGPLDVVIDAAAARVVRAELPAADLAHPAAIRIPITASSTLVGFRRKRQLVHDASAIADEILYSVANRGDRPVTVTIEEELRGYQGAQLRHQRPEGAGELRRDRFRRVVEIAAGGIAQGAFVVQYSAEPAPRRPR